MYRECPQRTCTVRNNPPKHLHDIFLERVVGFDKCFVRGPLQKIFHNGLFLLANVYHFFTVIIAGGSDSRCALNFMLRFTQLPRRVPMLGTQRTGLHNGSYLTSIKNINILMRWQVRGRLHLRLKFPWTPVFAVISSEIYTAMPPMVILLCSQTFNQIPHFPSALANRTVLHD